MEKTFMILDTHICMGNQGSLYNQELRICYYKIMYSEFNDGVTLHLNIHYSIKPT